MNFDNLTQFLDRITAWRIPGNDCRISIGGNEVYSHQSGYADIASKRPMQGDELLYLYSLTKPITCTAALQLFEKGGFLMNDPVSEYLPEFKDMTVRRIADNGVASVIPAKNPITIRNLFTMTAGLTYDHFTPSLNKLRETTGGRCPTRDAMRAIAQEPLVCEPDESFRYSLCHDVLGGLIEVISGMKLGDYMKKNIFEPLGMKDTFFTLPEDKKHRMMTQYTFDDEKNAPVDTGLDNEHKMGTEYESGGAGLISSAADYMRFARAMCSKGTSKDGYRLLSPVTVDLMRTNHLTPRQREGLSWVQLTGYGYGLGVRTLTDPTQGSLSPIGEFGWSGMAGTYVIIDPENELAVFYGQQMINNQEPYVHPRIRNIIYSSIK